MDDETRCGWASGPDVAMRAYHDAEWGVPIRDERHLFELLILEGAQAGLSWNTILRKRDGYRLAFAGFEPGAVAAFDDADVARLLADPGIVRNRAKVAAAVDSAKATLALQAAGSSLVEHLWSFVGGDPIVNRVAGPGHDPVGDGRVTRDEQGPARSRVPVRRADDLLRADAVRRARERSRGHLPALDPGPGPGRGRQLSEAGNPQLRARQASRSFIRLPTWSTAPA